MSQRIAFVTGASSGIGRATAELLARKGYYVFAVARRMNRLEETTVRITLNLYSWTLRMKRRFIKR